eukprot:scaffold3383_cov129-Skeletonema_dohrnii-CCMP3373.AAC.2
MEQLKNAEKKLKAAHDSREIAYAAEIKKLDDVKTTLLDRLHDLNEQKQQCAAVNGNVNVRDDDLIEINAGGKIIVARRSVLCQVKGTRFEALFSGRWDKKLLQDSSGRIFLDVNGDCFQAIVDYLNELAISSEDERTKMPTISDEYKYLLSQYTVLFGLSRFEQPHSKREKFPEFRFSADINEAINEKWESLNALQDEITSLEKSFVDEQHFIDSFVSGEKKDIITLNVSGTVMTTNRATLMIVEDSVLAQQFDDTKWTVQGSNNTRGVKEWTPKEVSEWVKNFEGIKEKVSKLFKKNEINGLELLALNEFGLEKMGVSRPGTICLLIKAIKQLEKSTQDVSTLIEYSPYCFGKILDYLRLKFVHSKELIDKPTLPTVSNDQKERKKTLAKGRGGIAAVVAIAAAAAAVGHHRTEFLDIGFESL